MKTLPTPSILLAVLGLLGGSASGCTADEQEAPREVADEIMATTSVHLAVVLARNSLEVPGACTAHAAPSEILLHLFAAKKAVAADRWPALRQAIIDHPDLRSALGKNLAFWEVVDRIDASLTTLPTVLAGGIQVHASATELLSFEPADGATPRLAVHVMPGSGSEGGGYAVNGGRVTFEPVQNSDRAAIKFEVDRVTLPNGVPDYTFRVTKEGGQKTSNGRVFRSAPFTCFVPAATG